MLMVLLAAVLLIAFFVIIQVSDNLLRIQAKKLNANAEVSLFPSLGDLFKAQAPTWVDGPVVNLDKGFDIKLEGAASPVVAEGIKGNTFALQPANFRGVSPIPKVLVEVGANVKAGDPLFFDKSNEAIKYVSPVSGEVIAINRGERRSIQEVVILADKTQAYRELPAIDLDQSSREELVGFLLDAGAWPLLRQRPYDIVASTTDIPDNIFISTFDTAPLAPDLNLVVAGQGAAFQAGLNALAKLTKGRVHLGLNAGGKTAPASEFTQATGVEKYWFKGSHPAGNVGVQIHHIAPLSSNSCAWTLGVQEVITLGALFTERRFNASRIVALTGAELKSPGYVRTFIGANLGELLHDNLASDGPVRLVSGDVLSGQKKEASNYLNFYDDQVTALLEGNYYQLFGWLIPDVTTPTASRALPAAIFSDTSYHADTNTRGERRAFVVTGQYEDVLPMDIYPQHLMKAVVTNNFDRMEALGIHELIEEDIAICEFVCTSKQPLQQILREGLDMMHEQS